MLLLFNIINNQFKNMKQIGMTLVLPDGFDEW